MNRLTTHPGAILKEDFMVPLGLSARALAEAIHVPPNRISAIIKGTRSVTADTAIRLGRHFKTTPDVWLNLQQAYDLSVAERAFAAKPKPEPAGDRSRPRRSQAA